jgi:RimJ/RimL family protein N-acetyltransferase
VRNAASGRVLEKCGLSIIRRESRAVRGRNESLYVRGLTRDAWERTTGAA